MLIGYTTSVSCAHSLKGAGLCESLHGHTYRVDVSAEPSEGRSEAESGRLQAEASKVLFKYDGKNLNDFFEYPSCEHFCLELYKQLKALWPKALTVRVWEGEGKWAEASSDDPTLTL
jgi:6-pyruvoyltetrahydropterin/6-carboxytetrahydropterin synthase